MLNISCNPLNLCFSTFIPKSSPQGQPIQIRFRVHSLGHSSRANLLKISLTSSNTVAISYNINKKLSPRAYNAIFELVFSISLVSNFLSLWAPQNLWKRVVRPVQVEIILHEAMVSRLGHFFSNGDLWSSNACHLVLITRSDVNRILLTINMVTCGIYDYGAQKNWQLLCKSNIQLYKPQWQVFPLQVWQLLFPIQGDWGQ